MGEQTSAGTTVFIGTTATNAETDTYKEIGLIVSVGEYGRTYNPILFTPLKERGVRKHKGSFNDGDPVLNLGKDLSDEGQIAVAAAVLTDFDYNFKVVDNDAVAPESFDVTISNASPGVVTKTLHGLKVGTAIKLVTTGSLPTGLTEGTTYYVKDVLTTGTFTLSATKGGTEINTNSAGSGTHTLTTVPIASHVTFKAKVMSWVDAQRSGDSVVTKNMGLGIKSGSINEQAHLP